MSGVLDYLEKYAEQIPGTQLYAFLDRHGNVAESYTYECFNTRTNFVAKCLAETRMVSYGDPVLLAYPPGLEMIVAFFACAKLGAIPVPVAVSAFANIPIERITSFARNSGAKTALTVEEFSARIKPSPESLETPNQILESRELDLITWLKTDGMIGELDHFEGKSNPLLFLLSVRSHLARRAVC